MYEKQEYIYNIFLHTGAAGAEIPIPRQQAALNTSVPEPQSASFRCASMDFNAEKRALQSDLSSATTHLQIYLFIFPDGAWRHCGRGPMPRKSQVSLGCVQPIGWSTLVLSVHFGDDHRCMTLLLLLFLLCHAALQLCVHKSLSLGQQKVQICIRCPSRREGMAHSLDQADDGSQERQHWAHQVDLQQTPTGLLAQHLFDKGHQLLYVFHRPSDSSPSTARVHSATFAKRTEGQIMIWKGRTCGENTAKQELTAAACLHVLFSCCQYKDHVSLWSPALAGYKPEFAPPTSYCWCLGLWAKTLTPPCVQHFHSSPYREFTVTVYTPALEFTGCPKCYLWPPLCVCVCVLHCLLRPSQTETKVILCGETNTPPQSFVPARRLVLHHQKSVLT